MTALVQRQKLKAALREFFADLDYQEVETPLLVPMPGTEVHLGYFKTQWVDHSLKSHRLYLRSSPELHLKKLLSQGMERIFEFALCFRNEGEYSSWHRPEFTMLEWYQKGVSFAGFMQQTEDLIRHCQQSLNSSLPLPQSFHKVTVAEAFANWVGFELVDNDPELAKKAIDKGCQSVRDDDDFETAFFKILLDHVEPELTKLGAVFFYDYPASQAALAEVEVGVAKRFELYLNGVELCNAFLELSDWQSNLSRLQQANQRRQQLNKDVPEIDEEFIESMKSPIGLCCGNALGFDRLLALLMGFENMASCFVFDPYM